MPRIAYERKRFGDAALATIGWANRVLEEYEEQGFDLTLRQLFYQGVARGWIPNTERSYKRLGSVVSDARLSGYIDWDHIVDRTRNVRMQTHWRDPAHIIEATAASFKLDLWASQGDYVEVWIEKDALVGVIAGVCNELDVPYFSCRGYTSQSEMWGAAQRLGTPLLDDKHVTILHLGDHDPSGIDMTRDIRDRLTNFCASDYVLEVAKRDGLLVKDLPSADAIALIKDVVGRLKIRRIALNMAQIEQYDPPPNPAKVTDSRARGYIAKYGHESWELDALPPDVLSALVREHVEGLIQDDAWKAASERQEDGQRLLRAASKQWADIVKRLYGDA